MRRAIVLILLLIGLGAYYPSQAKGVDSLHLAPLVYSPPWDIRLKPLSPDSIKVPLRTQARQAKSLTQWLFGNSGLQFRLSGTAEIGASLQNNKFDNPNLLELNRRQQSLSLGTKIQLRAEAKLGRKLSIELGYDSEVQAEEWKRRIKLQYRGDSAELVQSVALGQLAFTPQNSLMGGARSLFGLRATLQRGRWGLDFFATQERALRGQTMPNQPIQSQQHFNLRASDYDEGRHFFLSDYFRSRYDELMAQRPQPSTGIQILRIELWVTNKRAKYDDARHILALADLGEPSNLHSRHIQPTSISLSVPDNRANSLEQSLPGLSSAEGLQTAVGHLPTALRSGLDYTSLEYARLLRPDEYVLNKQLGYVSLVERLQDDEELAVAYEYSYRGEVYRVGQLRADRQNSDAPLYAKLLKGLDRSPSSPYWHYMMRNVYALASGSVQELRNLQLSLVYESEDTGAVLSYMPKGKLVGERLMDILGLDLIQAQGEAGRDGVIDLIEGFNLVSRYAWVYLPYVEPFATPLRRREAEEHYIYRELYDRSQIEAKQQSRKDKYLLRGIYTATSSAPPSSREEQVSNRQTLIGVDARYQLSPQLTLGASAMQLREQVLGSKVLMGGEPMYNTMWGANLLWQYEPKWLDSWLSAIPTLKSKKASKLSLASELAYLNAGYQTGRYYDGYSVLDDFEGTYTGIDLLKPSEWTLGSAPSAMLSTAMAGDLSSGYGRAHLSWFSIDPIFTREQLGQMPHYIRNNADLRSSHYVREVAVQELYPEREVLASRLNYIPTLSLRYYPQERGMYNFDGQVDASGALLRPQQNWASIQRSLSDTDFEANNVEYLEFWLLDPFLEDSTVRAGGELLFHLGAISEDIIPDGYKSYEHSVQTSSADVSGNYLFNQWGKVSTLPSVGFAFDADAELRRRQDVGYNGLSSLEERLYASYQPFLQRLTQSISASQRMLWESDLHSPFNDPAGDDFTHYRSTLWDRQELPILERYKYFNGVEGNSTSSDGYARLSPDVEDLNQDNRLSRDERYYEYAIALSPQTLREGSNYIIASRTSEVLLPNGRRSEVRWYQFRIPLGAYRSAVGNIQDMKALHSMRMVLRGFDKRLDLRFASLRFVKGTWRMYEEHLAEASTVASAPTQVSLGAINLEEHSARKPINYVLPPTMGRQLSSTQGELLAANEQALTMKVDNLAPSDARAIYKLGDYDLRYYKRLQLFIHAEQLPEHSTETKDGDISLFLRIGSDFTHNYYEYSLPLELTPAGTYSNANPYHRQEVWRAANLLDLNLEELPLLKARRNKQLQSSTALSLHSPYEERVPERGHSLRVLGNPSLSRVRSIMVGIRNRSGEIRSIEVWINELRLSMPMKDNAWASQVRLSLELADVGNLLLSGGHSTSGWGDITQRLVERQRQDMSHIQLRGQMDLGRFLGAKAKTSIPIQYVYSRSSFTPEYSSLYDDVRLRDLRRMGLSQEEESFNLGLSQVGASSQTFNLTGVHIGIKSKKPMPYDPANIRLDYNYSYDTEYKPSIAYKHQLYWHLGLHYDYSPAFKPLEPFGKLTARSQWADYLRAYRLKLWPDKVSWHSLITRRYEEEQLRSYVADEPAEGVSPTWSHQFMWQRKLDLSWTPLPSLRLNVSTATDARIESPYVQVNRHLNPDDYALWKESVYKSIADLGSPQEYRQRSTLLYTLPTSQVSSLSWLSATMNYTSHYEWERGAMVRVQMPHTISSQRHMDYALQMNMRRLYNLIPKLKRLSERSSPLLAVRELSLSYRNGKALYLPGYTEGIGDAFGQWHTAQGLRPGLDFAFGLYDASYIRSAMERGWLSKDANLALSGVYTESHTFDAKVVLQPVKGLSITLLGNHTQTSRHEQQYQSSDIAPFLGGDMQMTTWGLRGVFSSLRADDAYHSSAFSSFLLERDAVHRSLLSSLPSGTEPSMLSVNNPAVLIPAFRRTYTSGIGSSRLEAIPRHLFSLLPNWTIDYNVGNRLPLLGKYVRSLNLRHAYRGVYRVHSYDSFIGWQELGNSLLGIRPGSSQLSLAEDISAVSLSEQFYPLLGLDLSLSNGLSIVGQWRKSRTLSLALSAERLMESMSNEWSIGLSYQLSDLRKLWKPRVKPSAGDARGLILKVDYSQSQSHSLIRLLNRDLTHATLGSEQQRLSMSLDYELSRVLSLRAFYEWQYIRPLVSATAYPSLLRSYGLSLKLNLQQ